jgi:DNA polymerase I
MRTAVIDFETKGIERRPDYPPVPVSVSIKDPKRSAPKFLAWGHPTNNNCQLNHARATLLDYWVDPDVELVFHNAKFDLDVAETHLDLPLPDWRRVHDTLLLGYLYNPHARRLDLKSLAHDILDMPPEERDLVKEWILANVPAARRAPTTWGAYICEAPPAIVGPYANGDVVRTFRLFRHLMPWIKEQGMSEAYDRERQLLPILLRMERQGVPVATRRLQKAIQETETLQRTIERGLFRRLKIPKARQESFSFAGDQLADALEAAGKVDEFVLTKKGNRSVAADALIQCCTDKKLVHELEVHSQIATCLSTFMHPWLEQAQRTGGLIYTSFNQVRNERGGARTGRLSTTPNFQNILNSENKDERVPKLRDFIVPSSRARALFGRDYSQQELRIFAHFEDGPMLQAYLANPTMDGHVLVGNLIREITGLDLPRKPVKNLNFGALYGLGIGGLAVKLGCSYQEARKLKAAHARAIPGVKDMYDDMRARAKAGTPIRTWGGRLYYCEDPKLIDGRVREFDYKLVNYLVQGSAADCTKQAMINYDELVGDRWEEFPLLLQVHDELDGECPKTAINEAQGMLREAMRSVNFEVAMLSDGKASTVSWERMKAFKD